MIHKNPHPLAGQKVTIRGDMEHHDEYGQITPWAEMVIEDWWDRAFGTDWQMTPHHLALRHMTRTERAGISKNDEVVYGKINGLGVLVHISELEEQPKSMWWAVPAIETEYEYNNPISKTHVWNESSQPEAFVVDRWHMWGDAHFDHLHGAESWHYDHAHLTWDEGPMVEIWNGKRWVKVRWDPEKDSIDRLYYKERRYGEAFKGKTGVVKHARFFARLLVGAVAEGVVQSIRRV